MKTNIPGVMLFNGTTCYHHAICAECSEEMIFLSSRNSLKPLVTVQAAIIIIVVCVFTLIDYSPTRDSAQYATPQAAAIKWSS